MTALFASLNYKYCRYTCTYSVTHTHLSGNIYSMIVTVFSPYPNMCTSGRVFSLCAEMQRVLSKVPAQYRSIDRPDVFPFPLFFDCSFAKAQTRFYEDKYPRRLGEKALIR